MWIFVWSLFRVCRRRKEISSVINLELQWKSYSEVWIVLWTHAFVDMFDVIGRFVTSVGKAEFIFSFHSNEKFPNSLATAFKDSSTARMLSWKSCLDGPWKLKFSRSHRDSCLSSRSPLSSCVCFSNICYFWKLSSVYSLKTISHTKP